MNPWSIFTDSFWFYGFRARRQTRYYEPAPTVRSKYRKGSIQRKRDERAAKQARKQARLSRRINRR